MAQQRIALRLAASEQRAQARLQFPQVERLNEVVVGAGIQPGDAVRHGVARRQDEHRHGIAGGAQALQHLHAGQLRQAEVEHHRIVGLAGQCQLPLAAVLRPVDGEAGLHEAGADAVAEEPVVFDEKDSHAGMLARINSPLIRHPLPSSPAWRGR